MYAYKPSDEFAKVVREELISTLPFPARTALKFVPNAVKDFAISNALAQVIPLSFGAIASTQNDGQKVVLTKCGDMEEKVKGGFLKRIAVWFVADEVANVSIALHKEVMRLGREGHDEESWKLAIENNEVVLCVVSKSLIKVSTDTVVDLFIDSIDALKGIKDKIYKFISRK